MSGIASLRFSGLGHVIRGCDGFFALFFGPVSCELFEMRRRMAGLLLRNETRQRSHMAWKPTLGAFGFGGVDCVDCKYAKVALRGCRYGICIAVVDWLKLAV